MEDVRDVRGMLAYLLVSDLPEKSQLANAEAAGKLADHLLANDVTITEHGRWKVYEDYFTKRQVGWICSNCSAVSYDIANGDTPFCPHCGAMMDEEEDE